MTDDVLITRIADGGPKLRCPWTINFNQYSYALDSPLREDVLDLTDEFSTNSLAPTASSPW
jgi:hypothetical protein